ncbi:Protein kinase domain [Macleaya cordata]|uniref:Receptor-like serine/threonine-protein kinase n=1 Tax=Macleaya cordata TaxID=56857 RepID=A0A200RDT1_MACCD|nr:Protein kinase domain [Macleaya cordata]
MTSVTLLLPLFLLLLLLPISVIAQTYSNISLGSSLTANGDDTSWRSPSGDFAFGFRPLEHNLFLLAIWFDKIPDKTIVWYADGIETAPKGSKVELTNDGKLVLNDPQGKELWEAGAVNGGVSYAAMLDNGNFILVSRDSSINSWESFKQPSDTILPTQTMEVNSVLYSRQTENTFSRGRFRLRLLQDGNLVLNIVAFPSLTEVQYDAYYWSHTFDPNQTIAGYRVVFNESGYIYVVRRNGDIVFLPGQNIVPSNDVYYRATLDYDGVFTQYSYPRTSSGKPSWSIVWSAPDNICRSIGGVLGSGACGYNSYCILTPERRPTCKCPPGYSFVDPNNRFSGCKPNFIQQCQGEEWGNQEDKFELQTLKDINWPTSDYERLDSYNEQDCRSSCLNDCLCAVAIYGGVLCWKKKLPLSNGRYDGPNTGSMALIKIRKGNFSTEQSTCPQIPSPKKDRSTLILVGSLLLGSSVIFNLMLLARSCLFYFFKDYKKMRKINQESNVLISNLRAFTYKELEEATGGFKEELGKGAFGIVYKGVIKEMGSKNYIAVKKLDKVVQEGEKEFKTEVSVIGRTHHKNLVQLLGFCEEGQHRLLVYEFMSNSNLAKHLFEISKPDWNQRIQIATCIARGLMYLHEECNTQIIHCDIKPQNILLDDNFTARISDFGLAKLLMNEQTRTRTGIRGTKGYVAPEWFRNTPVTVKVDVYSFGVMLLEIICCRKSVELELGEEEKTILTDWAYDCYREGKLQDLVENDGDAMNDMRRLERLVMIAIWCIQEEPSLRPSMKKVLQMLEGVLDVYVPPCPYPSNTVYDHSQSL